MMFEFLLCVQWTYCMLQAKVLEVLWIPSFYKHIDLIDNIWQVAEVSSGFWSYRSLLAQWWQHHRPACLLVLTATSAACLRLHLEALTACQQPRYSKFAKHEHELPVLVFNNYYLCACLVQECFLNTYSSIRIHIKVCMENVCSA